MFVAGDNIIMIDGFTVYSVLRATPECYEIMGRDFMHICSRKFIDENFVLVSEFNKRENEDG